MARKLFVRESSTSPFIGNFDRGGWWVYKNGQRYQMLPSNTRVWSEDQKKWLAVR